MSRPLPLLSSWLTVAALLALAPAALAQTPTDQPTEQPTDQPSGAHVGYDGGVYIQSDDDSFRLQIGGRVQTQYELEFDEIGDGDYQLALSRFRIRRARIKLQGHALTPKLRYAFQAGFGQGQVSLIEYYFDYALAPGALEVRAGQWRLPFLRQQITSNGKLMLVDRSLVTSVFGQGFDVGVALHDDYGRSPGFEWVAGVFNGTTSKLGVVQTDDAAVPSVFYPSVVARVGYNFGGIDAYSETDFDGGPLRFAIGASGLAQVGVDRDEQSALEATVDYILKVRGFSTSGAVMLASRQDGDAFGDQDLFVNGLYAQAGYLIGDLVEPALRYSRIAYEGDGPVEHEALVGLDVYFWGNRFKWQTDAGALVTAQPTDTATDYRLRTQVQFGF